MPGLPRKIELHELTRRSLPQMVTAALCGAVAGAVIGTAVSLSIGLFYSSASLLIVAVIAVSSMLGALFGHVMASLLVEDASLAFHAGGFQAADILPAEVVDLADHKDLRGEREKRQAAMRPVEAWRQPAQVLQYRPDLRLFEIIVSTAQKA